MPPRPAPFFLTRFRLLGWALLLAAMVASGVLYRLTGNADSGANAPALDGISADIYAPLRRDQRLFNTALILSAEADSADERAYSAQTQHLADELLDRGFTIALEQAAGSGPPTTAGPAQERVQGARARVAADQVQVKQLQAAAQRAGAAGAKAASRLAIVQARLELDQARLADAVNDAGDGGNAAVQRLSQLRQQHEAIHGLAQQGAAGMQSQLATEAQKRIPRLARGLVGEIGAAWLLDDKKERLEAAEAAVRAAVPETIAMHNQLHAGIAQDEAALNQERGVADSAKLLRLHALSAEQKRVSQFDQQADTATELANTYDRWIPLAVNQEAMATHAAMRSVLELLFLLAGLWIFLAASEAALRRARWERKRVMTLRHLLRLTAETAAALVALMVLFGEPQQLFTVIGLASAGLAVAFQDAILSVAGWFVLIGASGVHLGDWVEINGVVGEVIEIHLLKTVLLETGNWMTAGHPTGRRVFFPNSFALKGSYFNFSTSGQWLWDEIQVDLAEQVDAHAAATRVHEALERELAAQSEHAKHEWRDRGHTEVNTAPTVQLVPVGGHFRLVARYTTPARERSAMRERIWSLLSDALEQRDGSAASAEA